MLTSTPAIVAGLILLAVLVFMYCVVFIVCILINWRKAMSRGINQVFLIGNLGKAPEMRTLPSGDPVANFSVATGESWTDKNTGEKKEKTEWHQCVAFGKLAGIIGQYLTKGSRVHVQGKLQTRKWQDQQGQDRYTTEVVVNEMLMLDNKGESAGTAYPTPPPVNAYAAPTAPTAPPAAAAPTQPGPPPVVEGIDGEDKIPF